MELKSENNDCIIRYLDKIKMQYIGLKDELQETKSLLKKANEKNAELLAQIDLLVAQQKKTSSNSAEPKLQKTNSFQKDNEQKIESKSREKILPNTSTDDLNEIINCTKHMEDEDEDSFFAPTQTKPPTVKKIQPVTPTETLLPDNTVSPKVKHSPEPYMLPKRLKYQAAQKSISNNVTVNTSKWMSTERTTFRACKEVNINSSPQFNQSIKSSENEHPGPTKNKGTSPNFRKRKNLFASPKFKQTKLNFKENTRTQINDVGDDDIVEASPTSVSHPLEYAKSMKFGTARKLNHQKPILSISEKTNSLNTIGAKESTKSTPPKTNIKTEQEILKESSHTNLVPSKSACSNNVKELSDNSSLLVLSSQPDDLILIEDTQEDITASALLGEITDYTDGISESLQRFKAERPIEKEKQQQLQEEEQKKMSLGKDEKLSDDESEQLPTIHCKECQAYANYLHKNLSKEEIASRLSNCKHLKSVSLNVTPDGFWDPIFRPLPDDDLRNITLIDTRFIDKKINNFC